MRLLRLMWRPLGFASVVVLAPFAADAQTVVNPGAGNVPPSIQPTEELNPAARTPQAQPRRREDDLFAPPPPGACPIGAGAAARLFRLGILARVEIPVQTISDGHLKLEITAAHVVSVEVKGDAGP